jgi:hypothetical protein
MATRRLLHIGAVTRGAGLVSRTLPLGVKREKPADQTWVAVWRGAMLASLVARSIARFFSDDGAWGTAVWLTV